MSYIIAATDFSPISNNAVAYSAGLATTLDTDLVIMHAFVFPVMINDMPLPASLIDDTQKDAEKKMAQLLKSLREAQPSLNVNGIVAYGNLIDSIEKYAAEHRRPMLIVMGNSNTLEDSAWFFSTLRDATAALSHPVLAVPQGAAFGQVNKVCFASDAAQKANAMALQKLTDLCVHLKAELHVYNAQEDGMNRDNIAETDKTTKDALAAANPHYHIEYDVAIDEGIHKFCTNNSMNWLVVMPGKYSFLEGLFHKSHTKALAKTMEIPMLILH